MHINKSLCFNINSLKRDEFLSKEELQSSTIADWLQHVHSSFVHFAASLQILVKESQNPEEGAVILQDFYVVRHVAVHRKVLLGLRE